MLHIQVQSDVPKKKQNKTKKKGPESVAKGIGERHSKSSIQNQITLFLSLKPCQTHPNS